MRVLFLFQLVCLSLISFSQSTKKPATVYLVKYYFSDSTITFKTTNLDSIRAKTISSNFVPDSLETYKNGKLNGPKKIFSDELNLNYEYKNGKVISEKVFSKDRLFYVFPLDSSTLIKTKVEFTSGRKYFDREKIDTLLIINKTIPEGNLVVSVKNLWLARLGGYAFAVKIENKEAKEAIIRVQTSLTDKTRRIETFRFPIK